MKRTVLTFLALAASADLARSQGVVTLMPARDATLYSESGATANGSGEFLFAGRNSGGNTRRALVYFDVAAALPPGVQVTRAELVLHLSQQNSAAEPMTVSRLAADWGEGASDAPGAEGAGTAAQTNDATWTERFFGVGPAWTTPGGDFAAPLATTIVDGVGDWTFASQDLTASVEAAAQVPWLHFGYIVHGNEASAGTAKRFDSSENANLAFRPRLVVTYSTNCNAPDIACFGAVNSTGHGALLGTNGLPSVFANDYIFETALLPPGTNGTFFFGTALANVPFGDGVRCAGGTLHRFGNVNADANGHATRRLDFSSFPGSTISAGSQRWFQFAYRDFSAGGAGFNASMTLRVTFCP